MTGRSDSSTSSRVRGDRESAFDALASAAAAGTSRRQFVRLAGGIALTALLPGWARSGRTARLPAAHVAKTVGTCPPTGRQSCNGSRSTGVSSTGCAGAGGKKVASGGLSSFNGCGPEGGVDLGIFGTHDIVPDEPLELANFFNACKGHDCCYGTCGSDKAACDGDFLLSMEAACQSAWPSQSLLDGVGLSYCLSVAKVYYDAVSSTKTGTEAYTAGQDVVCDCCVDCKTAIGLTSSACEAQFALTCPDPNNPGEYVCVEACGDPANCGSCGHTCPPRDNGDGTSQRGCCNDNACTWEVGCIDYCSCWNQPGG